MAAIKIVTQNTTEPVLLADMKTYLRVDSTFTADDTLITSLITAARNYLEGRTNTILTNATVEAHFDSFPIVNPIIEYSISLPVQIPINPQCILDLPTPLLSVTDVQYRDENEEWQTLDPSTYIVDTVVGRIQTTQTPTTSQYLDAVIITCTTGQCTPRLRQALLAIVADWYVNREASVSGNQQVSKAVERIIWLERDLTLA